jgi:hypothetical protein
VVVEVAQIAVEMALQVLLIQAAAAAALVDIVVVLRLVLAVQVS